MDTQELAIAFSLLNEHASVNFVHESGTILINYTDGSQDIFHTLNEVITYVKDWL